MFCIVHSESLPACLYTSETLNVLFSLSSDSVYSLSSIQRYVDTISHSLNKSLRVCVCERLGKTKGLDRKVFYQSVIIVTQRHQPWDSIPKNPVWWKSNQWSKPQQQAQHWTLEAQRWGQDIFQYRLPPADWLISWITSTSTSQSRRGKYQWFQAAWSYLEWYHSWSGRLEKGKENWLSYDLF